MKTYVKMTETMGRGVFASEYIYPNQTIEVSEILELSQQDTSILEATALKQYKFVLDATKDCIAFGNASLYNHANKPNARYEIKNIEGRKCLVFTAIHLITPDQEIFINYQDDAPVNLDDYGIKSRPMSCCKPDFKQENWTCGHCGFKIPF